MILSQGGRSSAGRSLCSRSRRRPRAVLRTSTRRPPQATACKSPTGALSDSEQTGEAPRHTLARTYGTTVEKAKEEIARTGTRSIRQTEEALEQQGADHTAMERKKEDAV